MSANSLQNLAIDLFRARVQVAYQSGSRLRMAVEEYTGVEGLTLQLPSTGYTDATERESGQPVHADDAGSWKPIVRLRPAESWTFIDKQDQAITNAQWMTKQGDVRGKAIGRKHDARILAAAHEWDDTAYPGPAADNATTKSALEFKTGDAMALNTNTRVKTSVGKTITGEVLSMAVSRLMDQDVGVESPEDCFAILPASRFNDMADDLKNAYWNYTGQGTDVAAMAKFGQVYGCTPIFIGNAARRVNQGRMVDDYMYVWAKSALALAVGTTETLGVVEWNTERRSWQVGAETNSGAARQMNNGICKIQILQ